MSLESVLRRNKFWVVLLLSAIVILAATSGLFKSGTVISVSKVEIDPQGYEDAITKEWRGSFWIVTMLTDCTDQVAAIKLANDDGTPGNTYAQDSTGQRTYSTDEVATGQTVVPQSTIEIRIEPEQPYWERPLEIQQGEYASEAYGGYQNKITAQIGRTADHVDNLPFIHYEWGTGSWTLHTPFYVVISKNGVVQYRTETPIDTVGGTQSFRLPPTGDEHIYLTNLGKIETGYGEPQMGDILYFSNDYIFQADTASRKYITSPFGTPFAGGGFDPLPNVVADSDTFATYWYNRMAWHDTGQPAPWEADDEAYPVVDPANYGGWIGADDTLNYVRKPVKPCVFPGDKNPAKQAFMSLTEYLNWKGVARAKTPSWLQGNPMITADKKMRLYMPYGSVSSLVTLKISTELADTIVWKPLVAKFDITNFPNLGDIADEITSTITVSCVEGEGSGSITFSVNPATAPLSLDPPTIGIPSMKAGDVKQFTYKILNLGTENEVSFSVTAVAKNMIGAVCDTATASGKLLKKTGALTVLTVRTLFNNQPVSGIQVTVKYAEQTKSGITDTGGAGSISFSLESYQGIVSVETGATNVYQPGFGSVIVASGTQTVLEINLQKWGQEGGYDYTILLYAGLGIAAIAVVTTILYKKRRKSAS